MLDDLLASRLKMWKKSPKLSVNFQRKTLNVHAWWLSHKVLIQLFLPSVRWFSLFLSLQFMDFNRVVAVLDGKSIQDFPVKKPQEIVDTNGAGDSFVGGKWAV